MELHGVEIDCTGPVKLPLYERLVAGGALLLVVMVNGRVSNDYCFLDSERLGYFVATEACGGARAFEVMTAREFLSRICIWRMPCAPTE